MSPILVRPVREQLEHDRIIRLLQAKNKRKFDAAINPGAETNAPVGSGPSALYPDVVLSSLERGRRLQAIIEVETGESVNHLEALAIGVQKELVDDETAKRFFRSVVTLYWSRTEPFIKTRRAERDNARLFKELETLYTKWKDG